MPNKIALVTGGNRGIGFAVVKALVNQGDTTVWLGARDLELGNLAVAQIGSERVKVIHLDVTHPKDAILACEHIKAIEGRGIDILINNADFFEIKSTSLGEYSRSCFVISQGGN